MTNFQKHNLFFELMSVIENKFTEPEKDKFYSAIIYAQEIKEDSWNGKEYIIDNQKAALLACEYYDIKEDYIKHIIFVLNESYWNEIQDFIEEGLADIKELTKEMIQVMDGIV